MREASWAGELSPSEWIIFGQIGKGEEKGVLGGGKCIRKGSEGGNKQVFFFNCGKICII